LKTGEEYYVCAEQKRSKCPCTALVRYFEKKSAHPPVGVNDGSHDGDGGGEQDGGSGVMSLSLRRIQRRIPQNMMW
jgi:hypothetical protein